MPKLLVYNILLCSGLIWAEYGQSLQLHMPTGQNLLRTTLPPEPQRETTEAQSTDDTSS